MRLNHEDVSFGFHRRVEGEVGARQQRPGRHAVGPEKDYPEDCRGPGSRFGFGGKLFKSRLKIPGRELVVFVLARHANLHSADGRGVAEMCFTGGRQQVNLGHGPSGNTDEHDEQTKQGNPK